MDRGHPEKARPESESAEQQDGGSCTNSQIYQIRVKGHLDSHWSGWFDGLNMTHEKEGTTLLTGPVADQPALHGLLIKIRDLGLTLISVNRVVVPGEPACE